MTNSILPGLGLRDLAGPQRVMFIDYLFKTWNLWRTGKRVKSFAAPAGRIEPVTLAGPRAA